MFLVLDRVGRRLITVHFVLVLLACSVHSQDKFTSHPAEAQNATASPTMLRVGCPPDVFPPTDSITLHHRQVLGVWLVAPASGIIDTLYWLQGSDITAWTCGGLGCFKDPSVVLRLFQSFITPDQGPGISPYLPPAVDWGHWNSTADPDRHIAAFREDATDTAWQSTYELQHPGAPPSFPPFANSIWGLTGVPTNMHASEINKYPLIDVSDFYVTKGDAFFISIKPNSPNGHPDPEHESNVVFAASNTPMPSTTTPFRTWQFFEHDSVGSDSAHKGWRALDGVNVNMWVGIRAVDNPQQLHLIRPNGGELVFAGTMDTITWTAQGVTNLRIELSTDGGSSWSEIVSSTPASAGKHPWLVPNTPTQQALLLISDASKPSVYDLGNSTFTIHSVQGVLVNHEWELLSVPSTVPDYGTAVLFPQAISRAFTYHGVYLAEDPVRNGVGYWLNFQSYADIFIPGNPRTEDSIDVEDGWNMIGSLSSPVAASSISSIPEALATSQFFGYNGTYFPADTLFPYRGYWVRVSGSGKLILSASEAQQRSAKGFIRIMADSELPPPPPGHISSEKRSVPQEFSLSPSPTRSTQRR